MKKTVFYFFIIATIFAAICFTWRPFYTTTTPQNTGETTKYGAFLAAQHAIYVNDFKKASDFAKVFSDISYETPRRAYCLAEFLGGNLPDSPEKLAKSTDASSRLIYDAYLVRNDKWDDLYARHKPDKSALYAPLRIWAGIAKNRITETLKYVDTIESNPSWRAFVRGQIYAETGDTKRAVAEFAKVSADFMNINDYVYIMSFYNAHDMPDAAEKLHKDFTASPAGMFMADYNEFPEWTVFSGLKNALAFNFIQNVSHTKIILFSDLSVLMLRFAQIITPDNTWIGHSIDYYMGQFFSNMGGDYQTYFESLDSSNPFYLFAQMRIAEETDDMTVLRDIVSQAPLFIPAINKLVAIYTGAGDKNAALRVINNALENDALSASGRVYLTKRRALVYFLFGDLNRAQADIHTASKHNKLDTEILTIQARIWAAQGREIENAYNYAMSMIKHDPTDIVAWDTLAVVVSVREGNDEALDILRRVGRTANSCSSLFEHLGDAYAANGDKELAAEAYLRAIELSSDGLSVEPKLRKKLRKVR